MCSECGFNPCLNRCPNANVEIYKCEECGDEIMCGRYACLEGIECICENCLEDMTGLDLAERLGLIEIV